MNDRMIQFRVMPTGEMCLFRVSMILCLFPVHRQIRTIENSWTLEVHPDDWPAVERAFRNAYLGNKVHAAAVEVHDVGDGVKMYKGILRKSDKDEA